jgi:hypothetical protein
MIVPAGAVLLAESDDGRADSDQPAVALLVGVGVKRLTVSTNFRTADGERVAALASVPILAREAGRNGPAKWRLVSAFVPLSSSNARKRPLRGASASGRSGLSLDL